MESISAADYLYSKCVASFWQESMCCSMRMMGQARPRTRLEAVPPCLPTEGLPIPDLPGRAGMGRASRLQPRMESPGGCLSAGQAIQGALQFLPGWVSAWFVPQRLDKLAERLGAGDQGPIAGRAAHLPERRDCYGQPVSQFSEQPGAQPAKPTLRRVQRRDAGAQPPDQPGRVTLKARAGDQRLQLGEEPALLPLGQAGNQ